MVHVARPLIDDDVLETWPLLYRALVVAAAGGHHILLNNKMPPKDGVNLEVATLLGQLLPGRLVAADPHVTLASLLGISHPGLAAQAEGGVLYMPEAPAQDARVLDGLCDIMDAGRVEVSRGGEPTVWPARFLLVAARTDCPCGTYRTDRCHCTPTAAARWRARADRLFGRCGINIDMPATSLPPLPDGWPGGGRIFVGRIRSAQAMRHAGLGCSLRGEMPAEAALAAAAAGQCWGEVVALRSAGLISQRTTDTIARVALTLADLGGRAAPSVDDVNRAIRLAQ